MDRRPTTNRLTTVEDTRRVPVIDYAPTRIFRSVRQACRTPARPPAVVIIDPDARSGRLAHPRLVRRLQAAAAPAPKSRPASHRDFEDEPTTARR